MTNVRLVALTLGLFLGLVGCSTGGNGGTGNITQRCMTACERANRLCMNGSDCAANCAQLTTAAATPCSSQINAALSCAESTSDANLCGGTACTAQQTAVVACLTPDAGSNPDTGM